MNGALNSMAIVYRSSISGRALVVINMNYVYVVVMWFDSLPDV